MFNNREVATAILIAVIIVAFAVVPSLRRSVGPSLPGVLKALFVPRLVVVFLAFLLWAAGWIVLAAVSGLWDIHLLKDSIIIIVTLGFPMLVKSVGLKSGPSIVRTVLVESIGLTAVLAFYLNLTPFPLWLELIVQPVLTLLVVLHVFSATKEEWARVHRLFSVMLIAFGVLTLTWTTSQVAMNFSELDLLDLLRSFVLSVALPAVLVPFFYMTAFHAYSELALVRIRLTNPRGLRRVRWAIWLGLHFRVSLAAKLTGRYNRLGEATGFRDARRRMAEFRSEVT